MKFIIKQFTLCPKYHEYYYIVKEGGCLDTSYLHSDGVWRYSTLGENGEFTGFFKTIGDARKCINKHCIVVH
jgi:hypothetical protein